MASIFTQIIDGDIPAYKVAENDMFFAFLDIRPMAKGHTLVVPKKEVDVFFDQDEPILEAYLPFARKVAHAIEAVVPCFRIGISVFGLEVPHAHMHLIPINSMEDMNFQKDPIDISDEELIDMAERISDAFVRQNPSAA